MDTEFFTNLTLEFLWWFKGVAFFRDDAESELKALGADSSTAWYLTRTDAFSRGDFITLWGEHNDSLYRDPLTLWINSYYTKFMTFESAKNSG